MKAIRDLRISYNWLADRLHEGHVHDKGYGWYKN